MSWTADVRRARTLSPRDVSLLIEAAFWLVLVAVATRVARFETVAARIGLVPGEGPRAPGGVRAEQVGWAVRAIAVRAPVTPTCLRQALAGAVMLRLRGLPSTLTLGVAKDATGASPIAAHAWLRSGDEILTGAGGHERFRPLSSFRTPV